jgi:hypothetical protein
MGKLSAFQLSHIVALQTISEGIDEDEVKYHLGAYGLMCVSHATLLCI